MSARHSFGQHPPASHTIVHLSDPHLLAEGARLADRFDVEANLESAVAAIEKAAPRPDAVVITGDLADLGEPDAYRRLRAVMEPFAARLRAPLIWVAGNHDERPALRQELLGLEPSEEPVTGVWDLGGLRMIALD